MAWAQRRKPEPMPDTVTLEVTRYSPERDSEPSAQRFEVPLRKDWVVLDALNYIKDKVDGTLTYRWSCRMGICGSCGMMVNGEPKLTCATFLSSYSNGGKPIRVEPLRYFPVVRDLVVEMSDFMAKLKKVLPWLVRDQEKPLAEGEFLQTPEQLENYRQFSMCINCTLCYSACPVYGLDPVFVGPGGGHDACANRRAASRAGSLCPLSAAPGLAARGGAGDHHAGFCAVPQYYLVQPGAARAGGAGARQAGAGSGDFAAAFSGLD